VTRAAALTVAGLVAMAAVAGCSDSGADEPPTLDRIDGPAQVDPSYEPFATDRAAPSTTEADG
jgi:hypothetical protein